MHADTSFLHASSADIRQGLRTQGLGAQARVYGLAASVLWMEYQLRHRKTQTLQRSLKYCAAKLRRWTPKRSLAHLQQDLYAASTLLGSSSLCLPHTLVSGFWLDIHGHPTTMVHCTRRIGHRWDFHVWLEQQGTVVFSSDPEISTWERLGAFDAGGL